MSPGDENLKCVHNRYQFAKDVGTVCGHWPGEFFCNLSVFHPDSSRSCISIVVATPVCVNTSSVCWKCLEKFGAFEPSLEFLNNVSISGATKVAGRRKSDFCSGDLVLDNSFMSQGRVNSLHVLDLQIDFIRLEELSCSLHMRDWDTARSWSSRGVAVVLAP